MAVMKLLRLFLCLGFGLLLPSAGLIALALAAGRYLPYEGDLAYISTVTGLNSLYMMDVQRQFSIRLKPAFINDCCLTWSPDGHILTFVEDVSSDGSTDIFSMNFRTPIQRLTTVQGADLYPAYSPDGQQIAYVSYGFGTPQIYLMNSDGSQPRVLTGNKSIVNLNPHPVWSTDGHSILFSDFNNVNSLLEVPKTCAEPCEDAIQTAFNTNGLPLMTTSFIPLDQSRLFMAAFERTKNGGYGMYSLDTHSSEGPQRLTTNSGLVSPSMAVYDHWIAFVSGNTDPQKPVDETNLYVLDSRCIGSEAGCAGSIQQIASQLQAEDNVSWSADGRWLAYVTLKENISKLNLLDTTCILEHRDCTSYIHPLPITSARYIRPTWRPSLQ
jgi:Tol biopolymer transport system component